MSTTSAGDVGATHLCFEEFFIRGSRNKAFTSGVLKSNQNKGDVHAAPLRAALVLRRRAAWLPLAPGGFQGMDSTTRGLTKYLKGYYMWYMKNSLILFSVPPFVQVTNFRAEPAEEGLYFKVSPVSQAHIHMGTLPPSDLSCVNRSSMENDFGLIMLQSPARGSHSAKQHLPFPVLPEEWRSSWHQVLQYWCILYISSSGEEKNHQPKTHKKTPTTITKPP